MGRRVQHCLPTPQEAVSNLPTLHKRLHDWKGQWTHLTDAELATIPEELSLEDVGARFPILAFSPSLGRHDPSQDHDLWKVMIDVRQQVDTLQDPGSIGLHVIIIAGTHERPPPPQYPCTGRAAGPLESHRCRVKHPSLWDPWGHTGTTGRTCTACHRDYCDSRVECQADGCWRGSLKTKGLIQLHRNCAFWRACVHRCSLSRCLWVHSAARRHICLLAGWGRGRARPDHHAAGPDPQGASPPTALPGAPWPAPWTLWHFRIRGRSY